MAEGQEIHSGHSGYHGAVERTSKLNSRGVSVRAGFVVARGSVLGQRTGKWRSDSWMTGFGIPALEKW